jgi:hypothetical protein
VFIQLCELVEIIDKEQEDDNATTQVLRDKIQITQFAMVKLSQTALSKSVVVSNAPDPVLPVLSNTSSSLVTKEGESDGNVFLKEMKGSDPVECTNPSNKLFEGTQKMVESISKKRKLNNSLKECNLVPMKADPLEMLALSITQLTQQKLEDRKVKTELRLAKLQLVQQQLGTVSASKYSSSCSSLTCNSLRLIASAKVLKCSFQLSIEFTTLSEKLLYRCSQNHLKPFDQTDSCPPKNFAISSIVLEVNNLCKLYKNNSSPPNLSPIHKLH